MYKRQRSFLSKLRKARKPRGQLLHYIYVTEGGCPGGRLHHHLVVNSTGEDLEEIRRLWIYGDNVCLLYTSMERYTEKHYDGNGYYLICSGNCETFNCGDCGILDKIVDRLAAYEDTGLEPEDFKRTFTEDALLKLTGQLLGVTPDRLRELAQADKEGISPCTFCRFNPPSSGDGKPCCMCPAEAALRRELE